MRAASAGPTPSLANQASRRAVRGAGGCRSV